jgi:hypothetical protein
MAYLKVLFWYSPEGLWKIREISTRIAVNVAEIGTGHL